MPAASASCCSSCRATCIRHGPRPDTSSGWRTSSRTCGSGSSSAPPVAVATTDVAEVRFHGRNAALWEAPEVTPVERHRYDYRRAELAEWVPKIRLLHEGGRPVHVLMNNCADGACVRNAMTLATLLADQLE